MSAPKRPFYCHCTYSNAVPAENKDEVLRELCESRVDFDAVPDLCELGARGDPVLKELPARRRIAACYPRTVRWLAARSGRTPETDELAVVNMRDSDFAENIASLLENGSQGDGGEDFLPLGPHHVVLVKNGAGASGGDRIHRLLKAILEAGYPVSVVGERPESGGGEFLLVVDFSDGSSPSERTISEGACTIGDCEPREVLDFLERRLGRLGLPKPGRWVPWFPVIDYERCTDCKQCLNFCLFGVFAVDSEGKIRVVKPENCKTNCPACARVCPRVAIIFPKYKAGVLSGGEGAAEETAQVDIASLIGNDLYDALRQRQCCCSSGGERDRERALEERRRCASSMSDLTEKLDVPPEVLASISPGEIARACACRAAEAAAASEEKCQCEGDEDCACDSVESADAESDTPPDCCCR